MLLAESLRVFNRGVFIKRNYSKHGVNKIKNEELKIKLFSGKADEKFEKIKEKFNFSWLALNYKTAVISLNLCDL